MTSIYVVHNGEGHESEYITYGVFSTEAQAQRLIDLFGSSSQYSISEETIDAMVLPTDDVKPYRVQLNADGTLHTSHSESQYPHESLSGVGMFECEKMGTRQSGLDWKLNDKLSPPFERLDDQYTVAYVYAANEQEAVTRAREMMVSA